MSADVIILTGPPGAGKSTVARALAETFPRAVNLHTDDFWSYISTGAISAYLPESDAQNQVVMRVISGAAFTYADGGFTTFIDGVIGPWMLSHFSKCNIADAPRLHYVVLRPARAVALRRAQSRTSPDALVEEEPILFLWGQFADLGELEAHVLDTSDQDPAETLRSIADAVASGRFRLKSITLNDADADRGN